MDTFQSAYKKYQSIEMVLLRVHNYILMHLDQSHTVILILLDINAVFDTIDHNILFNRMKKHMVLRVTYLNS